MPPARAFADSPFDPNSRDLPTPPPPPTDEFMPPTPLPSYHVPGAPSLPSPGNSWAPVPSPPPPPLANWGAPLHLQAPETIDFAADAQPLTMRRPGPPGLLVLIVLLGAMAGGAKLAHVVTRGDVAAFEAPDSPAPASAPAPPQ
jgi:hypothetical protein